VAHGPLDLFADRVTVLDLVPRIGLELADAEADFLLVAVDAEDDGLRMVGFASVTCSPRLGRLEDWL
jgi:hypothetical protein